MYWDRSLTMSNFCHILRQQRRCVCHIESHSWPQESDRDVWKVKNEGIRRSRRRRSDEGRRVWLLTSHLLREPATVRILPLYNGAQCTTPWMRSQCSLPCDGRSRSDCSWQYLIEHRRCAERRGRSRSRAGSAESSSCGGKPRLANRAPAELCRE